MEKKIKHLELISATVSRMGQNSFQIRGWAVVVVSAFIGFSLEKNVSANLSLFPIAAFWLLDSYYLLIERRFRLLFDTVRAMDESDINFEMSPPRLVGFAAGFFSTAFSASILLSYGGLASIVCLSWFFS